MWHGEQFYCPDPLVDWMVGYGLSMDPCWVNVVYLLHGSLFPLVSIKGSMQEINHLLIGDPYRRWSYDGWIQCNCCLDP
jgi:hypothetical protein